MIHTISDRLLSELSRFLAEQIGLYFPPERWSDLDRGVRSAAREFAYEDAEVCIRWLLSSPLTKKQIEILASHLTVGETYFFREKPSFAALEELILPELIRSRQGAERRLRIWSAGCATGEEPYSIAILLSRILPPYQDWNITILATDINPRFLERAAEGVFTDWSFRDTPAWVQGEYFHKRKDGRWAILPSLKKIVTFSYLNLAEDVYPSLWNNTNAMDVIFCRNVLMYFASPRARRVIHNLNRSLMEGGWLIVSPSETSHLFSSAFATVSFPGATLYRKGETEPPRGPLLPEIQETSLPVASPIEAESAGEAEPGAVPPQICVGPPPAEVQNPARTESPTTPYAEAIALYQRGHHAEAAEQAVRWIEQNPEDTAAMALMARLCANQGQLAEALAWCEKAIAADKLNAGYHYLRALILQEQGAVEEACASLKRTLYLDPQWILAYFALGNLRRQEGRTEESNKYFENALVLSRACPPEEILPESDGITAARFVEIIRSMTYEESAG